MDYKEITKRHLEIMNSEYNLDQVGDREYSNLHLKENKMIVDTEDIKKDSSNTYALKMPYFFNFNNVEAPEDKVNIETHYSIPGTNSNQII